MPRQKISSECSPHSVTGRKQRDFQRRVGRQEPHHQHRQRHEMREPQHVEIDLVDRIHEGRKPVRNIGAERRNVPAQDDDEGEHDVGRCAATTIGERMT